MSNRCVRLQTEAGRWVSAVAAASVSVIAILVLVGWQLDIFVLRAVVPGFVAMNPTTAICFLLLAFSLVALSAAAGRTRKLGASAAAVAGAVAAVKLVGLLANVDTAVDRVVFPGKLAAVAAAKHPNWMAPNTAGAFVLTAIALLLLHAGRRVVLAQVLTLAVALAALLALIGYTYSLDAFYHFSTYVPMALLAALNFFLLSIGLFAARSRQGLVSAVTSAGPAGSTARRLLPAAVVVPILLGWLRLIGQRRGIYSSEFGVSLMVVSSIALFVFLIWWNARSLERAEAAKQEAEAEINRFFDLSLDMMCIAGFDGFFKRLNPAWENVLGLSRTELMSRPFLEFVHPDDRAGTIAEAQRLSQGYETISFSNRYVSKDGSYRWLLWNAGPDPEHRRIYAAARDITETKRAEHEIRALNEELTHYVGELKTLNEELEAFSYSVSHDLRAPLRHITGFAQLLEKSSGAALDEKGSRYLRTISDAAKRMGQLIDDLLAFSRTSRASMQTSRVDLRALCEEVRLELIPESAGREIQWEVDGLPVAEGDAAMLKQVFVNLLSNAVKYTAGRQPAKIEIGTLEQAGQIVVFVRDNGVGFDGQYAHRLFGVFQRLHRAEEFEGTGIGLANVRRIIHRHGGRTWAEGSVGAGATFYFSLPKEVPG